MRAFAAGLMLAGLFGCSQSATAGIILESASMGTTMTSQQGPSVDEQILGARFTLTESQHVTAIGGHIWSSGSIWAALVAMDDHLPTFIPLDVETAALVHATFNNINPSQDARAPVDVVLGPGNYAILFGGGHLFSTSGFGSMLQSDQVDISPDYFWGGDRWWIDGALSQIRFVVEGEQASAEVPEPSSLALLTIGGLTGLGYRLRRSQAV